MSVKTRLKGFHILTYGCQMNVYDTDRMAGLLVKSGYLPSGNPEDADILIFNTCSVRENAESRVLNKLAQYVHIKEKNGDYLIGLCGCMAKKDGSRLVKSGFSIDFAVSPDNIASLPEVIEEVYRERRAVAASGDTDDTGEFNALRVSSSDSLRAYIPVMKGCDNYCAYCVVPYVRGREISRSLEGILEEVRMNAAAGVKEIFLLGQNVNSYRGSYCGTVADFSDLLGHINDVAGIERIRFTTSHPKDLSPKLIEHVAGLDKVCEYIHLPMQAGSDRILGLMNRKYTNAGYRATLENIRNKINNVTITTDIIVGFPSETEEEFSETLDAVRDLMFDSAYMFAYSKREGTGAASMPELISPAEKSSRLKRLIEAQNSVSSMINASYEGREVEVLAERVNVKKPGQLMGRTRGNKMVIFQAGSAAPGDLVRVTVKSANQATLYGFSA